MSVPYHAWTHRPKAQGGTDPIEISTAWPWIVLENNGQTLPGDNAYDPSLHDIVYWDGAITPDPTTASVGDPFEVSSEVFDSIDYYELRLLLEGFYMVEMVHNIDSGNGGAGVYFQHQMSNPNDNPFDTDKLLGRAAIWLASGAEVQVNQWVETFRVIWNAEANDYGISVRQNTGVDKAVGGHTKVWYLGGVGGGTDRTAWEVGIAGS